MIDLTAMARAFLALLVTGLFGCSSSSAEPQVIDDPYAGGASFPSPAPISVPAGPIAMVSNNGSDTISFLDLTTHTPFADVPVGIDPVGLDGPHHLAFDPAKREIFVALAYPAPAFSPGPHAEHGSSTLPGKVMRLGFPSMSVLGVARVDENPGDIVISEDGSRVVVTHFDLKKALANPGNPDKQRARLLAFDAKTIGAADAPAPVAVDVCVAPHGVVLSRPDGRYAYVACYGEDALAVVDLADPAHPVTRTPVGPDPGPPGAPQYGPYAIALSEDGSTVAIGNTLKRDLRMFDAKTGALLAGRTYPAQGAVMFPVFLGGTLYVPVQTPDMVVRLDVQATTFEITKRALTKDECVLPHEIQLGAAPGEVLLVCEGDHKTPSVVLALDGTSLATTARMNVGAYPDRLVVAKGGAQ